MNENIAQYDSDHPHSPRAIFQLAAVTLFKTNDLIRVENTGGRINNPGKLC